MRRWLVLLVAIVGLAAAAVVDRVFSGTNSEDARAAAAKLNGVPAAFGDWTSIEQPQDPKVIRVAEATGYVSRIYSNRKKNLQLSVLLLCGPTGPIGAHTPEVCYAGSGHEMNGTPQKKTVVLPDNATATYWTVRFEKKGAFEQALRVGWMWGVDGDWMASTNPRGEFALRGALYKLYVQHAEPRTPSGTPPKQTTDQIQEFLTDFLPVVKKALTAPTGQPDTK
jgi:hypothetical protein